MLMVFVVRIHTHTHTHTHTHSQARCSTDENVKPAVWTHRRHIVAIADQVSLPIQVHLQAMVHSHLSSQFRQNPPPPCPIQATHLSHPQFPLLHRPRNLFRKRRRLRCSRLFPSRPTPLTLDCNYQFLQRPPLRSVSTRRLLRFQPGYPRDYPNTWCPDSLRVRSRYFGIWVWLRSLYRRLQACQGRERTSRGCVFAQNQSVEIGRGLSLQGVDWGMVGSTPPMWDSSQ